MCSLIENSAAYVHGFTTWASHKDWGLETRSRHIMGIEAGPEVCGHVMCIQSRGCVSAYS